MTIGTAIRDVLKGHKIAPPDLNLKDNAAVISYAAEKGLVDQESAQELGGDLAGAQLTNAGMTIMMAGADAAWGNTKK